MRWWNGPDNYGGTDLNASDGGADHSFDDLDATAAKHDDNDIAASASGAGRYPGRARRRRVPGGEPATSS